MEHRAVLLGALVLACSTEAPKQGASQGQGTRQPQSVFRLSAGCLGGVTGGGDGMTLAASGALFHWTQLGPLGQGRDSVLVRKDSALALRLHRRLLESHFNTVSLNEPGNITCFLELHEGSDSHDVAWPEGRSTKVPQVIHDVFEELMSTREGGGA